MLHGNIEMCDSIVKVFISYMRTGDKPLNKVQRLESQSSMTAEPPPLEKYYTDICNI